MLAECSLAVPVFGLMSQIKRNPSFASPRVARNLESGLKAKLRTPNVWSSKIDTGTSLEMLPKE